MSTPPWTVSDELWARVAPLVPPAPSHAKGGRPRMPDRAAFAAIVYVLRTGIQWNALPRELGASSTVHDRFQAWEQAGFFRALGAVGLTEDDDLAGSAWAWPALDGVMTTAPVGRAATGPTPTDRATRGGKRRPLTDGAGLPLAVAVDGATRTDRTLGAVTRDGSGSARPAPTAAAPPPIRSRGEARAEPARQPGARARRWVVARTHPWLTRARRRLVRWAKQVATALASIQLACAHLILGKVVCATTVSG